MNVQGAIPLLTGIANGFRFFDIIDAGTGLDKKFYGRRFLIYLVLQDTQVRKLAEQLAAKVLSLGLPRELVN